MSQQPLATLEFDPEHLDEVFEFWRRTRTELRTLRKVRVHRAMVQLFDVNGDWFEVHGLGYLDAQIIPTLDRIKAAYNRETIHEPTDAEYKEFKTGRCDPWAAHRVM